MASTKSVVAAAKSIPMMKDNLRKAFEELQSHSSSLASFNLQWKDIDDHFSGIEKSIQLRLKELESKAFSMPGKFSPEVEAAVENFPNESAAVENFPNESEVAVENFPDESKAVVENFPDESEAVVENFPDESEVTPRPMLKSLCLELDGKGLVSFINTNHKDLDAIRKEIIPALRLAPDPAKLVLEAVEGFHSPMPKGRRVRNAGFRANKKSCILLLESLNVISPEIKAPIKEKAKELVVQWKGKIQYSEKDPDALAFLQLLVSYDIASEIKSDEIMDLMVSVSSWKEAIEIYRNLGRLGYKVPALIKKLRGKGKQLDAVKFVYAFDLVNKFPLVPLLKAYVGESKRIAREVRKKGNNSEKSLGVAKLKEIAALRSVIEAVEEYKLESEYSLEDLNNRIVQLQQQDTSRKRYLQAMADQSSKSQEQPSKRPRPSSSTTPSVAATSAVATSAAATSVVMAYPASSISHSQYLTSAWPQGLSGGGSLYNHVAPSLVGNPLVMGANQSQTVSYGSYPPPGGLSSHQFNPSLFYH